MCKTKLNNETLVAYRQKLLKHCKFETPITTHSKIFYNSSFMNNICKISFVIFL